VRVRGLEKLREKKGLSRETLAREMDTSYVTIFRWEKGTAFEETRKKLLRLSGILGATVDEILRGK
jgi:transcriptional regulator with XRE-family HTH domain